MDDDPTATQSQVLVVLRRDGPVVVFARDEPYASQKELIAS